MLYKTVLMKDEILHFYDKVCLILKKAFAVVYI